MRISRFLALLIVAFGFIGASCSSDVVEPSPKDWSEDSHGPKERSGPEHASPSPSPSLIENDQDRREHYKDIDLENGDDIPEGTCGEYDEPRDRSEWQAILRCNPDHDYGTCGVGGDPVGMDAGIIGTSGDDVLEGTSKDEAICGMGGNDIIIGGGGKDAIYGGPGNDYIVGGKQSDSLHGGDGDDILTGANNCPGAGGKCGPDFMFGDSSSGWDKDLGDDVLLGGVISFGETMDGGGGDDLLVPTALRSAHNTVFAGAGNDVVVTLNFMLGMPDIVWLEENDSGVEFRGPINSVCSGSVEVNFDKRNEGSVSCSLPWGKKLEVLDTLLPVSATIDQDGEISMDMTLYNELGNLSVSTYRDMLKVQGSLGHDVCVCDLYVETPPDPRIPHDMPGE